MSIELGVRQVAALIPTLPETLRRKLKGAQAHTAPPARRDPRNGRFVFDQAAVEAWLRQREELRQRTGRPYLRWVREDGRERNPRRGHVVAAEPSEEVLPSGVRLSRPVYWRGEQWAVTAYGLECLTDPGYHFSWDRLEGERDVLVDHPAHLFGHMRRKRWVNGPDLTKALEVVVERLQERRHTCS
jgi:hypothetical protein